MKDAVWIQDVRLLSTPLPEWLKGVPTLVHKPSGNIHSGTQCLGEIERLCREPQGMSRVGQSIVSGKGTNISCCSVDFDTSTSSFCSDDNMDLDKYMKLRENQTKHFTKDNENSKEMVEIC